MIVLDFREIIPRVHLDGSFKAAQRGHVIASGFVNIGQETEHRGFAGFLPEFDEVFAGVVEAAFRLLQVSLRKQGFAELAEGVGQAQFVADHAVALEGPLKIDDGVVVVLCGEFHQRQIVIQEAQGAVVFNGLKDVYGFQIIGPGRFEFARVGFEVAEIYQGFSHGGRIVCAALKREHFVITGFRFGVFSQLRAHVAEVA